MALGDTSANGTLEQFAASQQPKLPYQYKRATNPYSQSYIDTLRQQILGDAQAQIQSPEEASRAEALRSRLAGMGVASGSAYDTAQEERVSELLRNADTQASSAALAARMKGMEWEGQQDVDEANAYNEYAKKQYETSTDTTEGLASELGYKNATEMLAAQKSNPTDYETRFNDYMKRKNATMNVGDVTKNPASFAENLKDIGKVQRMVAQFKSTYGDTKAARQAFEDMMKKTGQTMGKRSESGDWGFAMPDGTFVTWRQLGFNLD